MPLYDLSGNAPFLEDGAWVAPSADLVGDVQLGRQASVWFGAVIRADNTSIRIGDRSNIQDGAVLHSDPGFPLVVGQGVTVGHRAILHGCAIGNNVLVGMGATILNGAVIGENSLIGANALVTEGSVIPPGSLVLGAPAKVLKPLTAKQIELVRASSDFYVANATRYRDNLRTYAP